MARQTSPWLSIALLLMACGREKLPPTPAPPPAEPAAKTPAPAKAASLPPRALWTEVAPLPKARSGHASAVLEGGHLLVAGGIGGELGVQILGDAYVYDPKADSWRATEPLAQARVGATATLLPDGQVLIVGGETRLMEPTARVERFDPKTSRFLPAAPLPAATTGHTATRLDDGRVLVVGGFRDDYLTDAWLYDPAKDAWTATGKLAQGRAHHAAVLTLGDVIVTGGEGALDSIERYAVATGRFELVGRLRHPRAHHGAAGLADGSVLIIGGNAGSTQHASTERLAPDLRTTTGAGDLSVARTGIRAVRVSSGHVIVIGGQSFDPDGVVAVDVYDEATQRWTEADPLDEPRQGHSLDVLADGSVVAVGGTSPRVYPAPLAGVRRYVLGREYARRDETRPPPPPDTDLPADCDAAALASADFGPHLRFAAATAAGDTPSQGMVTKVALAQGQVAWGFPRLTLFDLDTLEPRKAYPVAAAPAVALSADAKRIAAGHPGGGFQVFDVEAGTVLLSDEETPVNALAFSPDGQRIAVGGDDYSVDLWHIGKRERLWSEGIGKMVYDLHFRRVGSVEALWQANWDGWIWRMDPATGRLLENLLSPDPSGAANALASDASGRVLVAALGTPVRSRRPLAWRRPGLLHFDLTRPAQASGSWDKRLGEAVRGATHRVVGVAFVGPTTIAAVSIDGTLTLWDRETRKVLHRVDFKPFCDYPAAVASDGRGALVVGLESGRLVSLRVR